MLAKNSSESNSEGVVSNLRWEIPLVNKSSKAGYVRPRVCR